jgi:hypothetical protein
MKKVQLTALYGAAIVLCGTAGFAQAPAQQAPAAEPSTTIVGCVVREADYRRTADAGRGGVAGTGIGAGNEFVLINASAKAAAPAGAAGAGAATATGTSGATGADTYELTGPNEGQLQAHVGKRVELAGRIKAAEVGASGPTGGPTAGAPPKGVDVASKDLQLREFEVTSVREATGTCPAAPAAPAAK